MIGSWGHFIPKGFEVLSLDDPIHIPSILDALLTSPDNFLNTPRRLKKACAESMSDRTAVVSSAYWRSFVSSPSVLIPIISVTNYESKSLNWYHEQIRRKTITLLHAPFLRKIVSCETIVDNTTFNIVIQCPNPTNKLRTKTKGL